jgi:hyperosmotically inducible protein
MYMTKIRKALHLQMILAVFLFGLAGTAMASNTPAQPTSLADQVRHQILMLPYYTVFDNIGFTIQDQNTVVLTGQVTLAFEKDDAAAAMQSIKGVRKVINNIEILPLSRFDNSIRFATYWAIYSKPGFEKYAIQAHPPIKIIVKNGHVTLDGYVLNELEKTTADLAANSVPGVFSVTDNLKIG